MTDPEPSIQKLADCRDSSLVGGKAINLGRLLRAGFHVPDGFVVTTAAYRRAHAAGRPDMPTDLADAVRRAWRDLGSPHVAVRSSATAEDLAEASMAGQYETFLGISSESALLEAVRNCWASLDSPRIRTYLAERRIAPESVAMAVVVQRQVPSDVSGVLFTTNPHAGRRREMLVEAAWGLGEAVVSGRVQPDTLRLDRASGEVLHTHVGDKTVRICPADGAEEPVPEPQRRAQCLTPDAVRQLWELGRRIEDHFGSPQDIEWGIHDGRLYLLQSRAITTLEHSEAYDALLEETQARLRSLAQAGHGPWVIHNIAETLPRPTPLTWSIIRRFMSGAGGFGAMYRLAGFRPSDEASREGFLERIAGKPYMDASMATEMFFADFPFRYDLDQLRTDPDASQSPPTVPSGSLPARFRAARRVGAANRRLRALADDFDRRLTDQIIPDFVAWCRREKQRNLAALSADEWIALWRERERRGLDEFAPQALLPSLISGMAVAELRAFLDETFWDEDPDELADRLSASPVPDKTVEQSIGLYQLAAGRLSLEAWMTVHGHRGPGEFDLASPRWRERPDEVRTMAQRMRGGPDPAALHHNHLEAARREIERLRSRLAGRRRAEFDRRLALVHRYIRFREDGKYYLIVGCDLLRDLALEAARRLRLDADDVFLLTFDELSGALRSGVVPQDLLAERRTRRQAEARLLVPHVIDAAEIEDLGRPPTLVCGEHCAAFAVSHGTASGPARIVRSPETAGDLGKGYVLVCTSTDPAWTPLFVGAAALVLEQGGTLSHGAIVAREMGIPAVVLAGATAMFADGETITVDGHNGAVLRAGAEAQAGPPEPTAADTHADRALVPPPSGSRERAGAKVRNYFLLAWGAILVAAFALPEAWLYGPSLRLMDALLWPLVPALGRPATVAVVAAAFAVLTMVGQRLLADHHRLREAKRRAALLTKDAARWPADSPRRQALMLLAAPVQTRVVMAAFVPLAVLLGPLVVSVMWLADHMPPDLWNADPGATVDVVAAVESDFPGTVSIQVGAPLALDSSFEPSRRVPPIRETLEKHAAALAAAEEPADLPERIRAMVAKAGERQPLSAFLAEKIPPQTIAWKVRVSEAKEGVFPVAVAAEGAEPVLARAVFGDSLPPAPAEVEGPAGSPVRSVRLAYSKPETKRVFWAPLARFGWAEGKGWTHTLLAWTAWDWGWLVTYILAYLPAMFALRRLLGIP